MTENLTAAQQTQLDNRDSAGQWKAKTHADVEDTAGVLGVEARPDSPSAFDPSDINPLSESAVDLTGDEEAAIAQGNHHRWDYHRSQADQIKGDLAFSPGGGDDELVEAARFHQAAQWAYEADPHASFAAFEEREDGDHDLVQYNRHGQVLRGDGGAPKRIGVFERARPSSIPREFTTDAGDFDIKKARAASDDHLETTPRPEFKPWERPASYIPVPEPRSETAKSAYAKAAHRASPKFSRFAGESADYGADRDLAADEAEAMNQATRHVPTTSQREPASRDTGVVDHPKPGEVRDRGFDFDEARAEAGWQREL